MGTMPLTNEPASGFELPNFGTLTSTLTGMIGVPLAGNFRPYGRFGAAKHWAVTTTTQTNAPLDIDPGGTQEYGFESDGWNWIVGGGMEVWPVQRFGFYGEMSWTYLRGESPDVPDFTTDDRLMLTLFGLRLRLGP